MSSVEEIENRMNQTKNILQKKIKWKNWLGVKKWKKI